MTTRTTTKTDLLRMMLLRAEGAALIEICAATGWQPHSARAAISGLRKAGVEISLEKAADDAGRRYRLAQGPTSQAETSVASVAAPEPQPCRVPAVAADPVAVVRDPTTTARRQRRVSAGGRPDAGIAPEAAAPVLPETVASDDPSAA